MLRYVRLRMDDDDSRYLKTRGRTAQVRRMRETSMRVFTNSKLTTAVSWKREWQWRCHQTRLRQIQHLRTLRRQCRSMCQKIKIVEWWVDPRLWENSGGQEQLKLLSKQILTSNISFFRRLKRPRSCIKRLFKCRQLVDKYRYNFRDCRELNRSIRRFLWERRNWS